MTKGHSHLSDDRLIALCLEGETAPDGCATCEARRTDLAALLDDISDAATQEADAAFPAERLARQQARILQRLIHDGRPARVIAFPGHGHDGATSPTRPATRWIAAAAAAGLVIGLAAGHYTHRIEGRPEVSSVTTVRPTDAATQPALAVATTFSEDEFLGQLELAADSPGGGALQPLHDLTPRAWEVK
jgi:hypothetical protein